MIRAQKKFILPVYHFFNDEDYISTLRASAFFPKANLITKEGNYRFYREKFAFGKFFCDFQFENKATAEKPHGIGYSYFIEINSRYYLLKPGHLFDQNASFHFDLFENDQLYGTIMQDQNRHWLNLELSDQIPIVYQCFIFCLGYRSWICHRGWRFAPFYARYVSR